MGTSTVFTITAKLLGPKAPILPNFSHCLLPQHSWTPHCSLVLPTISVWAQLQDPAPEWPPRALPGSSCYGSGSESPHSGGTSMQGVLCGWGGGQDQAEGEAGLPGSQGLSRRHMGFGSREAPGRRLGGPI